SKHFPTIVNMIIELCFYLMKSPFSSPNSEKAFFKK
ncbi:MAG: hypothetical protein ACI9YH_004225, partial [Colwellia sp.]